MGRMGLGKKLITGGATLIALPMVILCIFLLQRSTSTLTAVTQHTATQTVEKLVSMVRTVVDKEIVQVKGLSALGRVAAIAEHARMNGRESIKEESDSLNKELFGILQQLGDQYSGIFVSDTNGLTLAGVLSNGETKGYEAMNISDRVYFKEAKSGGKANVAPIAISKATNKPVMVVYSPIRSAQGEFLGILALTSKVDLLINLVADTKVGETGYAFMLDDKGTFVAHPKRELILDEKALSGNEAEELVQKMTQQEKGLLSYNFDGDDKTGAFAPVGVRGWSVGVIQSREELLTQANAVRNQGILIGLGLLIAMLIPILLFARSITKPITRVVDGLSNSADQVGSVSGEVSSASQQLAEGASQQAAAIEETSSSLEEMASMTKQNAENAAEANRLMGETKAVVESANESMSSLTASMDEISRASEDTQKIIKTIDEIAFQTNLLALNAAVEAARAGEAGAGFAVVADEVRNLAMRAAEAAKMTASQIEGTVKRTKDGSVVVGKASSDFSEVGKRVAKIGQLIGEIAAASSEQAQGIEQVNKAVGEMDQVVQRNAANAEESASASEEMNAQALRMKEFVSGLQSLVGASNNHAAAKSPEPMTNKAVAVRPGKTLLRASQDTGKATDGRPLGENGTNGCNRRNMRVSAEQLIPFEDSDF